MEKIKLKDVKKYLKNTKKHPKKQIDKIKLSIKEFGYISPIIIDKDNNIIAGHGRAIALEELGYDEVEVIRVENLTAAQIKAYRIADNKLTESEWDYEYLKKEILELEKGGFDIKLTGFDIDEIGFFSSETDEGVNNAIELWGEGGGYDYHNKSQMGYKSLIVHFKTEKNYIEFSKLIKQNMTKNTKYIWFPKKEQDKIKNLEYISDEEN